MKWVGLAALLAIASWAVVFGLAGWFHHDVPSSKTLPPPSKLRRLAPKGRPVMHTFFIRIDEEQRYTGMTNEADDALLKNWKQSWHDAGWEPRVLTEKDAEKHPEYETLKEKIDALGLDEYNRLCLIRWITMASMGGGWMTDYDVFPLNDFRDEGMDLPNDGVLTVFDRYVPSLVSGVGHEWIRMAKRMVEDIEKHGHEDGRRDIMALQSLYTSSNGDMFRLRTDVLGGETALTGKVWSKEECEETKGMRAVHFSHRAIKQGKTSRPKQEPKDRPDIAEEWLAMWHYKCHFSRL